MVVPELQRALKLTYPSPLPRYNFHLIESLLTTYLFYQKIEQPFLKAVKQTLDERCNETIEEIYKIAIKLIIETIADGYGEDDDNDDDNDLTGPNEKKDPSSAGGGSRSNNNDNGNDENFRDSSGSNSNTRAKGNSGAGSNKFAGQQAADKRKNKLVGGALQEGLEASGFVNVFRCKRKLASFSLGLNRSQEKRKGRVGGTTRSGTTRGCMQNCNVSSNDVGLLNLHKQTLPARIEAELGESSEQSLETQKQQQTRNELETGKSRENEMEMEMEIERQQPNCSTTSSDYLANPTRGQHEDAAASPLKQLPNDERLKETLFVLKGLLSSLTAKKRENKNGDEKEPVASEGVLNKFTSSEVKLSDDRLERDSAFNKVNGDKVWAERDTNVLGMETEPRVERKQAASNQASKCLLAANLVKDNKEDCCAYREKFNKDNETTCYSIGDHTLEDCDKVRGSCRFLELEGKEAEEGGNSLNSDNQDDSSGSNNKVTCLIDQQPSLVTEQPTAKFTTKTKLNNLKLEDEKRSFSDACLDNTNIIKSASESPSADNSSTHDNHGAMLDSPEGATPVLASPLRVNSCKSGINTRNGNIKLDQNSPETRGRRRVATNNQVSRCEVKSAKKQVPQSTLKAESHDDLGDSENHVNYNDIVKKPATSAPAPTSILNFASISAAPPLYHTKSIKWVDVCEKQEVKKEGTMEEVDCKDDDYDCETTRSEAPPLKTIIGGSSIWCKFAKDIVRTSRAPQTLANRPKSHNELPLNSANLAHACCFTQLPGDVVVTSRSNLGETVGETGETQGGRRVCRGETSAEHRLDVNERLTRLYPRWGLKCVCSSLLTMKTSETTKQAVYEAQIVPSQQQKLPLVSNLRRQTMLKKGKDERGIHLARVGVGDKVAVAESKAAKVEEEKMERQAERDEYKQAYDKQAASNQFGAKKQTRSFLMPPFWSHIKLSPLRALLEIKISENCNRNSNRQEKRNKTNNSNHHRRRHLLLRCRRRPRKQHLQEPDVSLESPYERSHLAPKDNGEDLSKLEEQIELRTASKISTKTSLLTTDLGDLGELIKMLMLTIASKKQHHLKQHKTTTKFDNININSNLIQV